MAEPQESPKMVTKLLDAGLLVFLATTLSLCATIIYVCALCYSLHFPFQSYIELKDYLELTPYWLGPVLGFTLVMVLQNYIHIPVLAILRIKKREPGQKWRTWFRSWFLSTNLWVFFVPLGFLLWSSLRADLGTDV
jgi:hypothetical protein